MTPYAKRLLKYAIAFSPLVRAKGVGMTFFKLQREDWARAFLDRNAPGWQGRKGQPKGAKIMIIDSVTTTDEDDES